MAAEPQGQRLETGYDVDGGMKALGLYDPDKVKLVAVEMPTVPAGCAEAPALRRDREAQGRREARADAIAVCYTCHRVGTNGVDFGPDLSAFGKQQTSDILVQAIAATVRATISHGFEGSEVKTKDGLTITGMVLSNGDPLIIKCMGGLVQTVPQVAHQVREKDDAVADVRTLAARPHRAGHRRHRGLSEEPVAPLLQSSAQAARHFTNVS